MDRLKAAVLREVKSAENEGLSRGASIQVLLNCLTILNGITNRPTASLQEMQRFRGDSKNAVVPARASHEDPDLTWIP